MPFFVALLDFSACFSRVLSRLNLVACYGKGYALWLNNLCVMNRVKEGMNLRHVIFRVSNLSRLKFVG